MAATLKEAGRDAVGTVVLLSANPIHDTGGGQRSAQLALELLGRGWAVVFVSHGAVTETVDLGLRYDQPRLVRWSLDEALEPDRRDALLDAALRGGFVVTQVPDGSWLPFVREATRRGVPTVYDCIDLWASELGRGWYRREDEADLARWSTVLTASAPALVDRVEHLTRRPAALLPNAYNARIFDGSAVDGLPRPDGYPEGGRVALYVGALWGGWMDWSLARDAAEALPDTTFVFVGDHRREGRGLPANCVFPGLRPQTELPPFLAHADVAFLPWKADDVTEATSPLKVFEFVAMGLPVVAPEVEPLRGVPGVRTAAGGEAFVEALASVERSTLDDPLRSAMARFAEASSWTRRVDRMLELVEEARIEDHGSEDDGSADAPAEDVGAVAHALRRRGPRDDSRPRLPAVRPFISVVIPAFNHGRWVGEAVDSAIHQSLPPGEIVVVDDGSEDGTADVVAQRRRPGLRLLRQENRGAHHALNRAARLSRGEWIAILNSDDAYAPQRLEEAWGVVRETGAALLFGSVRLVDDDGGPVDPSHPIAAWYAEARSWATEAPSLAAALRRHNVAVTTSNVLVHRALWEELGGFRGYRYVHDYDFLLRAVSLCPGRVVHEPSLAGVLYRVHGSNTISEGDAAHREREAMRASLRRPAARVRRALGGWRRRRRVQRRVEESAELLPVSRLRDVATDPAPGSSSAVETVARAASEGSPASTSGRPRIALVVDSLDLGGLEEVVALLALALPATGVDAAVLCVGKGGAVARRLEASGVPVEILAGRTEGVGPWARRQGVVAASSHFAPVRAVEALAGAGVPVVETVQNCYAWLDDEGWEGERRRVEAVSGVVAVSDTAAEYYRLHTGHAPEWVVPNAVHPGRAAAVPRAFARRRLGLDEDAPVLAFVGRLTEQKNPEGLLGAFRRARSALPDATLLLAGPADGSAGLPALRRRHGELFRSGAVRHLPAPTHVGTVVSAADAYVSDSFYEGWSVAASEAAWVGRPLILSETGGSNELVGASGARGRVVPNPCGDPLSVTPTTVRQPPAEAREANQEALVLAMTEVLGDRGAWRERESEVRDWARPRLGPAAIARRYAGILLGLS